jgi:glucan phosphoethanolaminetransferase (alkaline phosphatase superfamily)
VEAVSNGVKAFREPTVKNAQRTLTVIIFLLAVMLAGISYLVKAYGIAATDPGQPGYQSVLSMLTAAVFGKGLFYYLTIGSILWFCLCQQTPLLLIFRACVVLSRKTTIFRMCSAIAGGGWSIPTALSSWRYCVGEC